jgi:menaquinone-dependent protoporphyrinogen oxidase
VGEVLAAKGLEVCVVPPEQAGAIQEFDAVILGSAVYMGQWMKPARELAERQAVALAARPVWLFSSGPVGEPAKPADNPVDVSKILQATRARDHRIFTGRIVKKHLSFPDRAMASAIRAQEGDFRNWADIRACPHGGAQARRPQAAARGWSAGHRPGSHGMAARNADLGHTRSILRAA